MLLLKNIKINKKQNMKNFGLFATLLLFVIIPLGIFRNINGILKMMAL